MSGDTEGGNQGMNERVVGEEAGGKRVEDAVQ